MYMCAGVFPLKFLGGVAFGGEHEDIWEETLQADGDRFVFVGGKGGVGKTTTSAALAVACAEAGHNTLLVSTDPAHSLGDALDVELSGGAVARVEGIVGASLYAVEVEVDEAVQVLAIRHPMRGHSPAGYHPHVHACAGVQAARGRRGRWRRGQVRGRAWPLGLC